MLLIRAAVGKARSKPDERNGDAAWDVSVMMRGAFTLDVCVGGRLAEKKQWRWCARRCVQRNAMNVVRYLV